MFLCHFRMNGGIYAGVLRVDVKVGNKKTYDPRMYLSLGESAMAGRVKQAATGLRAVGTTIYKA